MRSYSYTKEKNFRAHIEQMFRHAKDIDNVESLCQEIFRQKDMPTIEDMTQAILSLCNDVEDQYGIKFMEFDEDISFYTSLQLLSRIIPMLDNITQYTKNVG